VVSCLSSCSSAMLVLRPLPTLPDHEDFNAMEIRETSGRPFDHGAVEGLHNMVAMHKKVVENIEGSRLNASSSELTMVQD
jgi:hypothetical protein